MGVPWGGSAPRPVARLPAARRMPGGQGERGREDSAASDGRGRGEHRHQRWGWRRWPAGEAGGGRRAEGRTGRCLDSSGGCRRPKETAAIGQGEAGHQE